MMTLEQLYSSNLVKIDTRQSTWDNRWSTCVGLRTKEIYVKVIKGPSKGTVGKVEDIDPKYDSSNGELDLKNASITYHMNDGPAVHWMGNDAYKRVQATNVVFQRTCKHKLVYKSNRKKPQARFTYHHFNSLDQELKVGEFVVATLDNGMVFGTITQSARTNIRIGFGGKEYTPDHIANVIIMDDIETIKEELAFKMLSGWDGNMWNLSSYRTEKRPIKKVTA